MRQTIDKLLSLTGWHACDPSAVNLHAANGVAIREFRLKTRYGYANDLLYIDSEAAGMIEPERQEGTLTGVKSLREEVDKRNDCALTLAADLRCN